jgi:hypothetical protein
MGSAYCEKVMAVDVWERRRENAREHNLKDKHGIAVGAGQDTPETVAFEACVWHYFGGVWNDYVDGRDFPAVDVTLTKGWKVDAKNSMYPGVDFLTFSAVEHGKTGEVGVFLFGQVEDCGGYYFSEHTNWRWISYNPDALVWHHSKDSEGNYREDRSPCWKVKPQYKRSWEELV